MCTQSRCIVLAQCHSAAKRRGLLPFGGRFVAEIFVQNLKWRVSQRGADVSYILIQLLLLYLKNLLSYTAWYNYCQAFIAVQILPSHICNNECVHNPVRIVLAQCHSAAKKRGLLPFGGRYVAEIFVQNLKWRVSQRSGRRKLYFDPTFITVSQKLAELYSLT